MTLIPGQFVAPAGCGDQVRGDAKPLTLIGTKPC